MEKRPGTKQDLADYEFGANPSAIGPHRRCWTDGSRQSSEGTASALVDTIQLSNKRHNRSCLVRSMLRGGYRLVRYYNRLLVQLGTGHRPSARRSEAATQPVKQGGATSSFACAGHKIVALPALGSLSLGIHNTRPGRIHSESTLTSPAAN